MSTINNVNPMRELAGAIVQNFDGNRDGSLSADEFTSFLSQLLGGTSAQQAPTAPRMPAGFSSILFPAAAVPSAAPVRTRVGTMLGFDERKLGDASHTTFKYQIGRILQFFPSTKEGLQAALPEIQKLVPGAKIVGTNGDKLDFGDYTDAKSGKIGTVDVLVGAAQGGSGWAWQPIET
jgi:hypothetical protein